MALQLGADTLAPDGGDWANLLTVLRLAAGIAHEIDNPLVVVLGNLQLLLDSLQRAPESEPAQAEASPQDGEQTRSLRDAYDAAKPRQFC
jgi:signal transduction histidine kinase